MHKINDINLQLFAVTQVTGQSTAGNKTEAELRDFYEKRTIDHAEPDLVHMQFGDPYPIPLHGGKTVEFRKFSPLEKATTPITEGVTPSGKGLDITELKATVGQYGDFVQMSDMLEMTSFDPMIEKTTKLIGSQAGRTLDTIAREVLCGGTNVIYAPTVSGGNEVESDDREDLNATAKLTPNLIFKAAAQLKAMNANPVDDSFVCIIHPYVAFDLMRSTEWLDVAKYNPENKYKGEIGKLGGVRFVESTEAKIIAPADLTSAGRYLTLRTALNGTGSTTIEVTEAITAAEATALAGKQIYVGGKAATIASATAGAAGSASLTVSAAVTDVAANSKICMKGAGADGSSVFVSLVIGDGAYGKTVLEGGGLKTLIKNVGSAGTSDPLDQRSTVGWKATLAVERLVEEFIVRIESGGSYSSTAKSN